MAPACTFSLKSNIKFDPSSFVTKELYIKCPVTGEYTPTGMKVSEKERAKMEFTGFNTLCRHCGQKHTWFDKDAVFPEEKEEQ